MIWQEIIARSPEKNVRERAFRPAPEGFASRARRSGSTIDHCVQWPRKALAGAKNGDAGKSQHLRPGQREDQCGAQPVQRRLCAAGRCLDLTARHVRAILKRCLHGPVTLYAELCRQQGRSLVLPAQPLIARLRRNRFAGWFCAWLMLLQLLGTGGHAGAVMPGPGTDGSGQSLLNICLAPASVDRPLNGPKKAPRGSAGPCAFCGAACPNLLAMAGAPGGLLPPPPPFTADAPSFSGTRHVTKAWRHCASVRSPPAPFSV